MRVTMRCATRNGIDVVELGGHMLNSEDDDGVVALGEQFETELTEHYASSVKDEPPIEERAAKAAEKKHEHKFVRVRMDIRRKHGVGIAINIHVDEPKRVIDTDSIELGIGVAKTFESIINSLKMRLGDKAGRLLVIKNHGFCGRTEPNLKEYKKNGQS